jgi:hypothetical protein
VKNSGYTRVENGRSLIIMQKYGFSNDQPPKEAFNGEITKIIVHKPELFSEEPVGPSGF